ncbi:NTP transferase domain-containing protein [bacterium]|nr:NTP transferase domain-containing protein [candidate division CSSED10-310 bacterium]
MKTMILTAGAGRKLDPLTETRPKPMIEICGEPLLSRLFRSLQEVGISHVDVVIGHHGDKIREYYSHKPVDDISIHYLDQESPKGVGDAVLTGRPRIAPGDFFLLVYGDILFSRNMIGSLLNSFKSLKKPLASVCLTRNSRDFGNIYMDHEMRINDIIEKPQRSDLGNYILAGAFLLPGTIMDYLSRCENRFIDALILLAKNEGLYASIWEGEWVDLGYPWDILEANQMLMKQWKTSRIASDLIQEPGSHIVGPVVIESGVILKSGANVIGPCFIGAGSFIGHNALLRNFTSIGAKSIVGFGVEMKNSVLFEQVEIGRLSFLGDSVIGRNVNIGSGTVMVNINLDQSRIRVSCDGDVVDSGLIKLGALVGDNTWIGAGHTLLPGTKISSGSIIPHHSTHTGKR